MKQIYHPYELWEDHKHGFYNNCSGEEKQDKINLVIEMFNSEELTQKMMFRVVDEWKYSCEHNLTNESVNKIAYIGQSACCLYGGIPNTVTMEAWSLLTKSVQKRSDKIALSAIKRWEESNKDKSQLCLKFG